MTNIIEIEYKNYEIYGDIFLKASSRGILKVRNIQYPDEMTPELAWLTLEK